MVCHRKKLVNIKDAPHGETTLRKLLILLLCAGVQIQVNLFPHYFLHKKGIDNSGIAAGMGWQQQWDLDDSDLPGSSL
jgi:hypothetical protein